MDMKIALAGNPNCGKTTLFNDLTGSNQYVGNWPGVTVEKKEGRLKGRKDIVIQDLPGIYSLSPYTLEEVVARNYLVKEKPDAILNIVDGTNIERNLYLTTQLIELGLPVVVAVNMMDLVRRNGDQIDARKLSDALGCQVVEISALKGEGGVEAAELAAKMAQQKRAAELPHVFTGSVEHAIAHIEESIQGMVDDRYLRWYAVKVFERDEKVLADLNLSTDLRARLEDHIVDCEKELDDDAESIITNQRYAYINDLVTKAVKKKGEKHRLSTSDKIDQIVTNRILALPIFAVVMFAVYWIAMGPFGTFLTDWTNDVLGTAWLVEIPRAALEGWGVNEVVVGLICDGALAGVGAVLGFVPQMLVLFLMLAFLEACGYMARIAFVLDRIFRKFGLSGKSFIPMLIGTGCGIPGIMASRTIENERDRRMTIMTTTFIPCGAKVPFIAMVAGAIFGGAAWVATSAYFVGMAAIIISGIMLKKTKMFAGDPAPFVMELPAYHWPTVGNVLRSMWERGWSFIKKAGTIILLSTIAVWFTTYFGWAEDGFRMLSEEEIDCSILAHIGSLIAWIFAPLGWGNWKAAVASITGLVAKENIVGTLGILYGGGDETVYQALGAVFTQISGYSFLVFNLLCAPCFAAIGAIKREMNNAKWTWFAIGYQCGFAYLCALMVNQFGKAFTGDLSVLGLVAALAALAFILYMLVRPYKEATKLSAKV